MPYKTEILKGSFDDILKEYSDIFVIPDGPQSGAYAPMCARLYQAAGYDAMEKAREDAFKELVDIFCDYEAAVKFGTYETPAYNLNAGIVIHADYGIAEICNGNLTDLQRKRLSEYYYSAVSYSFAVCEELHSITIPVLYGNTGDEDAREIALNIAKETIERFFENNPRHNRADVTIKLALPREYDPPTVSLRIRAVQLAKTNFSDCYQDYEKALQLKAAWVSYGKGITREEYFDLIVRETLYKIENSEKLAEEINYDKGSLSRFRNRKIKAPRKHRVIAIAIGMGLSDRERYEFIRSVGYNYPEDERDRLVEQLIRSGVTSFSEINEALCSVDKSYALDAPDR